MTGAHPVAFFLKELSGDPARRAGRGLIGTDSSVDAQIGEAHARGILEARAAAQVDLDAALAKQQAAFEQRLAAERRKWADEEGRKVATLLAGALGDIEQRVAEAVSSVLKPFVAAEIRAKAVEEFRRALSELLAEGEFAKVTVTGPEDLIAAIERGLSGRHEGLSFVAADTADVVARLDDAVIETRIGAWSRAIEGESQ